MDVKFYIVLYLTSANFPLGVLGMYHRKYILEHKTT